MQSILQLLEHNVLIAGFIITIMRGPELVETVNPALYVGSAGNLLGFQPGRELGGGLYSDATVSAEQLTLHGLLHPNTVKESVLDPKHQPEVQVDKSVCRYAALGHLLTANAAPGVPQVLAMREGMMLSLLMTCRKQKKKGEPELTQIDHQAAPNHQKSVSKQLQVSPEASATSFAHRSHLCPRTQAEFQRHVRERLSTEARMAGLAALALKMKSRYDGKVRKRGKKASVPSAKRSKHDGAPSAPTLLSLRKVECAVEVRKVECAAEVQNVVEKYTDTMVLKSYDKDQLSVYVIEKYETVFIISEPFESVMEMVGFAAAEGCEAAALQALTIHAYTKTTTWRVIVTNTGLLPKNILVLSGWLEPRSFGNKKEELWMAADGKAKLATAENWALKDASRRSTGAVFFFDNRVA